MKPIRQILFVKLHYSYLNYCNIDNNSDSISNIVSILPEKTEYKFFFKGLKKVDLSADLSLIFFVFIDNIGFQIQNNP